MGERERKINSLVTDIVNFYPLIFIVSWVFLSIITFPPWTLTFIIVSASRHCTVANCVAMVGQCASYDAIVGETHTAHVLYAYCSLSAYFLMTCYGFSRFGFSVQCPIRNEIMRKCDSFCQHRTIRAPLNGFLRNLILENITNIYQHITVLFRIGQQYRALRGDLHTCLYASEAERAKYCRVEPGYA
jgi:hypothetical protein